jgi:GGDEF domain-containing protein
MMMFADMPLAPVSQNELQTMAYTDPLTGLGNRYRMRDRIAQIAAERADDPAPFTICIANLDWLSSRSTTCSARRKPATRSSARWPTG